MALTAAATLHRTDSLPVSWAPLHAFHTRCVYLPRAAAGDLVWLAPHPWGSPGAAVAAMAAVAVRAVTGPPL